MYMKRDLPKYKITIDDEYSEGENLGISMIAFTSKPAIMVKGMAFNVDEPTKLYFVDELKYRICAPVMVPMEIYRCDSNEEYFVQFTVEEIDTIHQKFMSNLTNKNIFNLEHKSENVMPAFVLEAWIVDNPETDKAIQTYGISVPKGTLMMTTQITDKQVYSNLVNSGQVGYSIEGFLGLKLSEMEFGGPGSGRNPEGGSNDSNSNSSASSNPEIHKNENAAIDREAATVNLPSEKGLFLIDGKPAMEGVVLKENAKSVGINMQKSSETSGEDRLKATFTHNHPTQTEKLHDGSIYERPGGSFSGSDVTCAFQQGLGETRAVDKEYTHSLAYIGPPVNMEMDKGEAIGQYMSHFRKGNQLGSAYDRTVTKKNKDWQKKNPYIAADAQHSTRAAYEKSYYEAATENRHQAMQEFAKANSGIFVYTRTKK